jgi:REP element-mobilizing transposase RayT
MLARESSHEPAVETPHATSLRGDAKRDVLGQDLSEISPKSGSLGVVVRSYKAAVTRQARRLSFPHFAWQRGFYDHIIRDDRDLDRVREYIRLNPAKWALDRYFRGG